MRARNLLIAAVALAGCRDAVEPKASNPSALVSVPAPYEIVELGTLGGSSSQALAINDQTQIVGNSSTASGATHAFLWEGGVMRDLGTLGGDFSTAADINANGDVAGVSTDSTGASRVTLWRGGVPQDLGPAVGGAGFMHLGDGGHVVWAASTPDGRHAMLWDGFQVTDLGTLGGTISYPMAVNALGQITGASTTATGQTHAFLWDNGGMIDLGTFGGTYSEGIDLNISGAVTGAALDAAGKQRAFHWFEGQMTDLGALPGDTFGTGMGVSSSDQVIGISYPDQGAVRKHAFIWELGVMRPLRVDYQELSVSDDRVGAINDNGQVIGRWIERTIISHPWVWENGVVKDLPTLAGGGGVTAINNPGQIIGWIVDASHQLRAVLWRRTS